MAHSNRAVSTQGSKLYVQDIAAPNETTPASLTISSITAGNPTTVTFTAAHGLEDGAIVQLGTVTGAPAFDGLIAPITATTTTAVEMHTDTTGFAGTATGGTATVLAFHELCFVDFNQTGGEANQIETTTNCSTSKEY